MPCHKKVLIIKNISREGPGMIRDVLSAERIPSILIDLSQGDRLPRLSDFSGLVVLGGPDSANDKTPKIEKLLNVIRETLRMELPFLGVCLGMQALVKCAGGDVIKNPVREIGFRDFLRRPFEVELTFEGRSDQMFKNLPAKFPVFQLHGETAVFKSEARLLGVGEHCRNQIVRVGKFAYGFQCHFELTSELLSCWHHEDADLRCLDGRDLAKEFELMAKSYRKNAVFITQNFIRLIERKELIHGKSVN